MAGDEGEEEAGGGFVASEFEHRGALGPGDEEVGFGDEGFRGLVGCGEVAGEVAEVFFMGEM